MLTFVFKEAKPGDERQSYGIGNEPRSRVSIEKSKHLSDNPDLLTITHTCIRTRISCNC